MNFDTTYIAIRKRNLLEIIDLGLHVIRDHFSQLVVLWLVGAVPFFVLNHLLIGWMSNGFYYTDYLPAYIWVMILLVSIQSQLATSFISMYLGQAIFEGQPKVWGTIKSVFRSCGYFTMIQLLSRMVLPVVRADRAVLQQFFDRRCHIRLGSLLDNGCGGHRFDHTSDTSFSSRNPDARKDTNQEKRRPDTLPQTIRRFAWQRFCRIVWPFFPDHVVKRSTGVHVLCSAVNDGQLTQFAFRRRSNDGPILLAIGTVGSVWNFWCRPIFVLRRYSYPSGRLGGRTSCAS